VGDIKAIRGDSDLARALKEVSVYFDKEPEPGTEEADRFIRLCYLIEAYENQFHGIAPPNSLSTDS
jgi:HTH-type transcriptional regulator/antitoxin HigA